MPLELVLDAGWSEAYAAFAERAGPLPERIGRICSEHRGGFTVLTTEGERLAQAPQSLRKRLYEMGEDKPVVGDWVGFDVPSDGSLVLRSVLPRKSRLRRKRPSSDRAQVLIANVDRVLIVTSVGRDLNPRRVERYLALVHDGGAEPVLVLAKADLEPDREGALASVAEAAGSVTTVFVSSVTGEGLERVRELGPRGVTLAMLGSSGVGKSSLANVLLGADDLAVGAIRDDGKGRHTTTRRELLRLPSGGVLVDTPGMRELGLFEAEAALGETFPEVEAAAATCRFRDCRHEAEPGCGVRAALARGDFSRDRLEAYRRLTTELAAQAAPVEAAREQKRTARAMGKVLKARLRDKGRRS